MPFFLACVSPIDSADFFDRYSDIDDYLPIPPVSTTHYHSPDGTTHLVAFEVGKELRKPVVTKGDRAVCLDGAPLLASEREVLETFLGSDGRPVTSLPDLTTGYSAIAVEPGRIVGFRGLTGEYAIYRRRIDRHVLISNRLGLLLGAGEEPALDGLALAWIASNGYIYTRNTPYVGIERLDLGDVVEASAGSIRVQQGAIGERLKPTALRDIPARFAEVSRDLIEQLRRLPWGGELPLYLTLSGGKDSRAILALLDAAGLLGELGSVMTSGNLYSPEILSARLLTEMAGIPEKHEIQRPPYLPGAGDAAAAAVMTLIGSEGQLSLYDKGWFNYEKRFAINGQHNILRGSYFPEYPDRPIDDIAAIRRELEKTQPINAHAVIQPNMAAALRADLDALIEDLLARGVPSNKMAEGFMWLVRTANWIGLVTNEGNVHRATFNPLLDVQLNELALTLPSEIARSEVSHFLLMASAEKKTYYDVPFASLGWKPVLAAALDQLGWSGPRPAPVEPFLYSRGFPNNANPYMSNMVLDQFKMVGSMLREIGPGVRERVPWLDMDRMIDFFREDTTPDATRLISLMGAMTGVVLSAFGRDAFRRSRRDGITGEFARFAPEKAVSAASSDGPAIRAERVEKLLDLHEQGLATLVGEVRAARQQAADLREKLGGTAERAAPHLWRNVDVINQTNEVATYRFVLPDGRGIDRPNLAPGQGGTTGFVITGNVGLEVSAGGLLYRRSVELLPDRFSYLIKIEQHGVSGDAGPA